MWLLLTRVIRSKITAVVATCAIGGGGAAAAAVSSHSSPPPQHRPAATGSLHPSGPSHSPSHSPKPKHTPKKKPSKPNPHANPSAPGQHKTSKPVPKATGKYTVKPGDTLSGIAAAYGTTVKDLVALNHLPDPDKISVGQVLKVNGTPPKPAPVVSTTPAQPAPPTSAPPVPSVNTSQWKLKWQTSFGTSVALGKFPGPLSKDWFAYPHTWPDTATQRSYPVGGYYDPATTTWVSGGQLHMKMWRGAAGSVHSAAVAPNAAQGVKYGKFIETFRVSHVTKGYKSAHLLWPSNGGQNATSFEVDYPENEWDVPISAYVHYGASDRQVSFDTNAKWGSWHTTEIDWTPTKLSFYMDGKLVGSTTKGVPNIAMDWILQNESALNGESAAPNTSAQIDISYVAVYSWKG